MRPVASVDVGTNTALLLVADGTAETLNPLHEEETIVRLGEGVDESRQLLPAAMTRVADALEHYVGVCRRYDVATMLLTGTSAVRDAANREQLMALLRTRFGLDMILLSGEEEARLTFLGAMSNKAALSAPAVLIDIGGGSTELILGARGQVDSAVSLDIGSVRLTERVLRSDPVRDDELRRLGEIIRGALRQIPFETTTPATLVGVAGTVTTLAAMHLNMTHYSAEIIDHATLSLNDVERLIGELQSKTLAERKKIPGLHPKRADVILAGAAILAESMRHLGKTELLVSHRGLRYGVILDYLKRHGG